MGKIPNLIQFLLKRKLLKKITLIWTERVILRGFHVKKKLIFFIIEWIEWKRI